MSLNRQPGDRIPHSLEALLQIVKGAEMISSQDEIIGQATRLHERTDEIDPQKKLYQYYLRVARPVMGNAAFVPADFVVIEAPDRLRLNVTEAEFESERWDVSPTFIAVAAGKTHDLANKA